ncbi:hypothetical protein A2Z22_01105 [Candidatus Woesebacteria bacterium RBG_16_34_12]|uniref:Uncharacterized protein n=1 Tax=Candidatus Woesebacteria bacterium RBG_16_34_12 TaxID=1802480 RepID=A0A1F7X8A1_9BACT|nr:MAG: hypothetical protein A2Z22_01105 [Candidatus Woesebacteria bacterium RBG_16_34_12]
MDLNKIFVYIFLIGTDLFLWKYALTGLFGSQLLFKRGNEFYIIKGKRTKFFGLLFLSAAIPLGWAILNFLKEEL